MDKVLEKFIKVLKDQNKSNSTILAYHKDIEQLIVYFKKEKVKDFKKVKKEVLDNYLKSLLSSGDFTLKTVSRKLNSIKTFFRFLQSHNIISINVANDIKHPKFETKIPRILNKQEYMALRDASRDNRRVYIIIEILLQTGIRIGELSRLKIQDVIVKSGKYYLNIEEYSSCPQRKIEISSEIGKLLKEIVANRKNKSDYLFVTKSGKNLLIRNIRSSIDRHFEKAEIENASVNDLRNTFIVTQLKAGIEPRFLASYVGHERLTSTHKFIKAFKIDSKGSKKKVIEL